MHEIFERTLRLIGVEGLEKLQNAHVLVAGVGGVGSYVAETLGRGGIGELTLIDSDVIELSNLNRQLHALQSTVGQPKVEAMGERLKDINPEIALHLVFDRITEDFFATDVMQAPYDFIVDAVDDVQAKLMLIRFAKEHQIPVISSMGTANKVENRFFKIVDISETKVCPLARKMRKSLRDVGIDKGVKVVYSEDCPEKTEGALGTLSFVPGTAGLLISGYVIRNILNL